MESCHRRRFFGTVGNDGAKEASPRTLGPFHKGVPRVTGPARQMHFRIGTVPTSLCVEFLCTLRILSIVRFSGLGRGRWDWRRGDLRSDNRHRTDPGRSGRRGDRLPSGCFSGTACEAATSESPAHPLPREWGRCGAPPGNRSTVRFSLPSATKRLDELLGVVRLQQEHQQPVGGPVPEPDELPSVIDRHNLANDRQPPGLFFELHHENLFDLPKRLSVRFRDPHRVVVQFAGDARFQGGSLNETKFAVRVEERLLAFRDLRGHDAVL